MTIVRAHAMLSLQLLASTFRFCPQQPAKPMLLFKPMSLWQQLGCQKVFHFPVHPSFLAACEQKVIQHKTDSRVLRALCGIVKSKA